MAKEVTVVTGEDIVKEPYQLPTTSTKGEAPKKETTTTKQEQPKKEVHKVEKVEQPQLPKNEIEVVKPSVEVVKPNGEVIELQPTVGEQQVVAPPKDQIEHYIPANGSEQFASSMVEILFGIIVFLLLALYIKFKNHPWIVKLNLDPETVKSLLTEVLSSTKENAKQQAVKTVREKDIKIAGVHNMSVDEIKAYEDKAKGVVEAKTEAKVTSSTDTTSPEQLQDEKK